jgi:hypothetical protein
MDGSYNKRLALQWAKRNTEVFEKVFPFIPSANIRSWEDVCCSHGHAQQSGYACLAPFLREFCFFRSQSFVANG